MNSRWFQPRQSLLIAREHFGSKGLPEARELETIFIGVDQVSGYSSGQAVSDPDCFEPRSKFAYWSGKDSWMRFEVAGPKHAGRYLLLLEYATGEPNPSLIAEVTQGSRSQVSGPVKLPRGWDWSCKSTRSIELGEFELGPGPNQLLLKHAESVGVDVFSLRLVRLPETEPQISGRSSFHEFKTSANQISFEARLSQDGYVFLSEIHYPGWTATVDGKPVEILRANAIFRVLWVPAGTHQVEFRFWPRFLIPGAVISLATLTVVGLALAASRTRATERSDSDARPD